VKTCCPSNVQVQRWSRDEADIESALDEVVQQLGSGACVIPKRLFLSPDRRVKVSQTSHPCAQLVVAHLPPVRLLCGCSWRLTA
jgi:hypothetical protein